MEMLNFLKDNWVVISFCGTTLFTAIKMYRSYVSAVKCSLRNDILDIYDRCKETKKITHYQLQSIKYSSDLYFKLGGNSFVRDVVDRVKEFELTD